ncbi:MAG: hypothetical protein NT069_14200 [Planctomycetota bacterium]|nr:hypothetical protein [Planctomycetota bacterium]
MKQEDERLDAIYRRTVRLSPQNDADAQSTLLKTGPTISTIQSSRLTVVIQLSAAGMTDPQLNTMATQVELSAMGTVRGLTSGLRDAPTPQNDAERIQAEWVAAQRSVVVALSRVEKPADLRTAANELTSQKLKLEQLAARVRLLTPTEMANYTAGLQRFSGRLSALGMEFSALQQDLTMRHGHVAEFQRELANFEFARQQLEQAPGAGQNMAQVPQIGGFPVGPPGIPPNAIPGNVPLPPGVGAPPGFGGPPGINPGAFPDGFPRGFPGQGPGPFPGGPPGVAMPGGFPRIPSNVDEFAQSFIQQHGKDKTVILLIPGKVLNSNEQQRITEQMQSTFGAISASSAFSGGVTNSTMFAYALEGDIRQIAGKIKFAKVTAIDAANRRITIEVP